MIVNGISIFWIAAFIIFGAVTLLGGIRMIWGQEKDRINGGTMLVVGLLCLAGAFHHGTLQVWP